MFILNTNTKVILKNQKGYQWFCSSKVSVKGYAYTHDGILHSHNLLHFFEKAKSRQHALELISSIDGYFSVILSLNDGLFFTVDHMRSFPLFYFKKGQKVYVTDTIDFDLFRTHEKDIDSLKQFDTSLYVLGSSTLLKDVKQLQGGNCGFINKEGIVDITEYWRYKYSNSPIESKDVALNAVKLSFEKTFNQLIEYLDGRTAIIPLSGGHDSRLIAYYLKKLNYPKIIAFTYGIKGNYESDISRRVAEALHIPHFVVEYNRKDCQKLYVEKYNEYALFSGNAVSVPHIQEWYAIKWLLENKVIDNESIVIPGFAGDFTAGSLLKSWCDNKAITNRNKSLDTILYWKFFSESNWKNKGAAAKEFLLNCILENSNLKEYPEKIEYYKAAEMHERFIHKEHLCKFIQNALRTYEYWGLKWATPFFDKSQYEVWCNISNTFRYQRNLFFELEKSIYPSKLIEIEYANEMPKVKYINRTLNKLFKPSSYHYLMTHIPIKDYYYSLIKYRRVGINFLLKKRYMEIINNIKLEKN